MKTIIILILSVTQLAFGQSEVSFSTNYQLREQKKAGVGMAVGGAIGGVGGLLELNIEDADGVLAGFGSGSGYQSFSLAWKHSFEGEYFTPYSTLGMAHWWDAGLNSNPKDSSLLRNFLTDRQLESRDFGVPLVAGSVGMQFNQLSGDFVGSSFFIEFGLLWAIERAKTLPTGSVGALYYF
ncbi:MAG: hypothetical protein ACK5V3_03320 [Bdellovibrionales bacterium]